MLLAFTEKVVTDWLLVMEFRFRTVIRLGSSVCVSTVEHLQASWVLCAVILRSLFRTYWAKLPFVVRFFLSPISLKIPLTMSASGIGPYLLPPP